MDQGAFYRRLIEAYKNKTATDKELEVLMHLLREGKIDAYLIESMEEDSVSEDLEPAVIPVSRRSWIRRALPYAAACAVIACCLAGYFWLREPLVPDELHYATSEGEKRSVILADGSVVVLNENSRVQYVETARGRKVSLSGEAYFDIAHDEKRPFVVSTDKISVTVVGTAFNVRSVEGEDRIATTLLRGKVILKPQDGSQTITMTPDEKIDFLRSEEVFEESDIQTYYDNIWRTGNLVFENETLQNILPELGKWFKVRFEWDAQLSDCRYSMTIGNESLDEILQVLELSSGVKVVRPEGGQVRVSGKLCQ